MMRRMKRFGARRGFGRQRKESEWLALPPTTLASAQAATSTLSHMFGFEAPVVTVGVSLTSDPPEDRIIQRITAELVVRLATSSTAGSWTLGLLVVDKTWTAQGGTFSVDADKRILWSRTYDCAAQGISAGATVITWAPPNYMTVNGTADFLAECDRGAVYIDIKPKVRLEDGKSLLMCAWENVDGATLDVEMKWMRLLLTKAGR